MNRIRFQVGVPRAGDAARSAEREPRMQALASLAGSAARAAEAATRAEGGSGFQGARTIGMRATGGKVFTPETPPVSVPPTAVPSQSSTGPVLPVSQVSAMTQAENIRPSGPLQTAVSRVQSLVRSLFPGGRPRTS